MSILGCAGLCCQDMVPGQVYTFHFNYSGFLQLAVDAGHVQSIVAADSNFQGPVATVNQGSILQGHKGTVSVTFTYAGQGSVVGQAGQEMQNVINNSWATTPGTALVYDHADTGVVNCTCCDGSTGLLTPLLYIGGALVLLAIFLPDVFSFEALRGR